MSRPHVLVVGGSDSAGAAGLQADLRTVVHLGGHPLTAVATVTAQAQQGVLGSWPVPLDALEGQLSAGLALGAEAVKTGALATSGHVEVVARALRGRSLPLVVDPVVLASSGDRLLDEAGVEAVRRSLLPLATVVTPNLAETALLTGLPTGDDGEVARAASALLRLGARWVLVTGGHREGDPVDLLTDGTEVLHLTAPRVDTEHQRGTGCTLAAALATELARGADVPTAAQRAVQHVRAALRQGYALGGQGVEPVPGPAVRTRPSAGDRD